MGIENCDQATLSCAAIYTGDAHYPSWGSKTRMGKRQADRTELGAHLITPHGDRKPFEAKQLPYRLIGISLPLMGIENPALPSCWRVLERRLRSHYPSWGSKTASMHRSACGHHRCGSLPLMGIENPRTDPEPSLLALQYDSLPLMGIENDCADVLSQSACAPVCLITPHGDRKHASTAITHAS